MRLLSSCWASRLLLVAAPRLSSRWRLSCGAQAPERKRSDCGTQGNVMTSGAIDAGRGCSGRRVGRILEESYKLPQGPEDSEAFLQRLRVLAALARKLCTRDEPPGARGPAEPTLPRRVNLAARGPSAQTTAACLLSAAPRHQSGASSHVQAKQLLPITCSSPFSSPW
ncbi:unnamed protein product [Rangifer tarandus platyrhynchus]|uniref:Uncharacterized protein n=3 Tax=Rangifer tarandus platyrhynchus TaxID=3082113 RepID=A0AC59YP93_RANTA|nr:unnamed protein product [Rangifer tarandus platyrhynchus]CAI9700223.1 unnamed protein product [Rangifer tarandus platyrhynchus]